MNTPRSHTGRIRSFVLRTGRTTSAQQRALETLSSALLIPFQPMQLDWAQAFGLSSISSDKNAPRIVEIGFGMGETTASIAAARPEDQFLALDVHSPGVGALLKRIDEMGLTNVRVMRHDAVEVLEQMIAPNTLDGVHIFFPDPWHKKRHHKRRLIQAPFMKLLAERLKVGGYLHLATDWQEYAEQMLTIGNAEHRLSNTSPNKTYVPRPTYRPVTKFENRGLNLGHGVWDLVYQKLR
ncbi:tRNA (guanosine(46)-N7)-methyltransferase TrmB [Polynucleobacter sp. IMCC 30228]|uniref:tRNA (guanosine(46)-N7)-methyltransferase TrmB n=1 Tax=Polynucleobacter sp. IMCC 30228 TaxID=2781011 RepID=UPI001F43BDAA|nr:tRNA (guanosine(46)-N7)-methyltransferase TrmB [Polynucleobacter sp. IMCC 30228]MCE7526022.1 tRNA (guanosine(46)-N7)-methyltransferase TrmB [Polynucleobacter sp. IMCC 30228]